MRVGGWIGWLGVASACTSKVSVEVTNARPAATILAPVAGDVREPGEAFTLRGSASDPTDDPSSLVARWFVDGREPCVAAAPDESGETRCPIEVPGADALVVLEVTDRQGSTAQATATLEVSENTPPEAAITAPAEGAVLRSDVEVLLEGTVGDAETPARDLRVAWSSSLDGLLASPAPEDGGYVSATAQLRPGHHVLTLSAIDARAVGATDRVEIDVAAPNQAPTCGIASPASGSELRFAVPTAWIGTVADADQPAPDLEVSWSSDVDGALGGSVPTPGGSVTLADVVLSPGLHTVSMHVADALGALCVASAVVTVQAPPSDPIVRINPSPARTDDTLTAALTTVSVDPNGDPVRYLWVWRRDGVVTTESGPTVAPAATTKGEVWSVEVRASDGTYESAASTASVVIDNTPPTVADVEIAPSGPIVAGTSLSCTATVMDPDAAPLVTYVWTVDGQAAGTGPTFVAAGGRDATVTCTVNAVDSDGASASASASVGIENTSPTITSVQIAPASPVAGDALVCSARGVSDAEGDPVSLSYAWSRDGQLVGSGDTFAGPIVGGQVVSCTATPSDGRLTGDSLSASVRVANTLPVLAGPTLSPLSPRVGQRLTCTAGATDVDGTTPDLTLSWTLDGAAVGEGSSWTVPTGTRVGAVVRCTASADDGEGGTVSAEASTAVADSAPEGLSVTLAPAAPDTDDVLVASVQGTDANGELLTWSFVWTVDGDEVPGVVGPSLDGGAWFDAGETVAVTATASTPSGAASTSASVVVVNSPPSSLSVALVFTGGDWRNGLTCTVTSPATDVDGDGLTYRFAWDVDGTSVGGTSVTSTQQRVDGAAVASRQVWTCTVVADDGRALGPSVSASLIVPYCQTYLPDCNVSASVWTGNGHAYGLITSWSGWTWDQAAAAATAAGGHLATLASWDENEAAFARADPARWGSNLGPWLGATQAAGGWEPGGGWGWSTQEAFSFTRWAPGEPNNIGCTQGNEDAMHFFSSAGPLWNDHPRGGYCGSNGPVFYAVIEYDADCDASGTVDYADDCLP